MDKLILVLYVDVETLEGEEAENYVNRVAASLFTKEVVEKLNATTFVIPRRGGGCMIESLNPKFVLDHDMYADYKLKLDVLSEHIDHFIEHKKGQ